MPSYNKSPPRLVRPEGKSNDDLPAINVLDEAEARLREAKRLADEEAKRADEEVKQKLELQKELDTLRATQPMAVVRLPEGKPDGLGNGKPLSLSPQAVTFRGRYWKVTIPVAFILAGIPLIWTLISDYLQLKRDLKNQTETYGAQAKRIEEINNFAHEVAKSNEELREKVAELSGYLAGVLPKAGVKVPGAEPGAAFVNILDDPLPAGELKKRQKPIVVHTPVPAPAPRFNESR